MREAHASIEYLASFDFFGFLATEDTKAFLVNGTDNSNGNIMAVNDKGFLGPVCDDSFSAKEVKVLKFIKLEHYTLIYCQSVKIDRIIFKYLESVLLSKSFEMGKLIRQFSIDELQVSQ